MLERQYAVLGYTSRVTGTGAQALLWEKDGVQKEKYARALAGFMTAYEIPYAVVLATKNGVHTAVPFLFENYLDLNFAAFKEGLDGPLHYGLGVARGYSTLRFSPKPNNEVLPFKFVFGCEGKLLWPFKTKLVLSEPHERLLERVVGRLPPAFVERRHSGKLTVVAYGLTERQLKEKHEKFLREVEVNV